MKAPTEMTGTQLDNILQELRLTNALVAREAGVTPQYISQLRKRGLFVLSESAVALVWPVIVKYAQATTRTVASLLTEAS